ncbi:MAG: hypothetical protein JNJ83_22910 [Verrucomicrobiaceae bacterium]|nr:hypothetical protein [Verrucomicrobiaceae bacterium]
MATKIVPTLRAALERLKHGGTINGLLLGWRGQVLVNLLPYEDFRAERLVQEVRDARDHFSEGGRDVESFWFGFAGVHALVVFRGDCSLTILHALDADVDFLTCCGSAFLEDAQTLIGALLTPSDDGMSEADTQELLDHAGMRLPPPTNLLGRELI